MDEDARLHLEAVLAEVEQTFSEAMVLIQDPSRTGAALTIINMDTAKPLNFTAFVGTPPAEKAQKYYNFSIEKARRLLGRPSDLSSYQTRDPDNDRWGGAIRSEPNIISISGFPELWDEAIGLAMAVQSCSLNASKAREIAAISNNPHFDQLLNRLPALVD